MNAEALTHLQTRIAACRQCVHAGYLPEANPVFRGGAHHRRMVIGQAPGKRSHEAGVPWTGTSGRILQGWFAQAGFPPETFEDDWYFTSITRCFPGPARSGSGDRLPSRAEQKLCAPWLSGEIELVQPTLIVTLGALAAKRILTAAHVLSLSEIIGKSWQLNSLHGEVTVVPLPHPSGVSRWLNTQDHRMLMGTALERLLASQD